MIKGRDRDGGMAVGSVLLIDGDHDEEDGGRMSRPVKEVRFPR